MWFQIVKTRQILMVIRFGRIQKVWLVTFLHAWPLTFSLIFIVLAEELEVSCLSLPNKHFAFPPFGRQMEAWMPSFLLFVSSCFFSLFFFPIPLLLVAWVSLASIYSTTAFQLWCRGSPELYLYHSKATTEEILVRNRFRIKHNIPDKITIKQSPKQTDVRTGVTEPTAPKTSASSVTICP